MKLFPVVAAISVTFASEAVSNLPMQADQPAYQEPARPWTSVEQAGRERACRDRIEHARASAGKLQLDRTPTKPDEPLLMYAVDRRIEGCGVLVPVSDPADIRQIPKPGKPQVRRIVPGG